MLPRLDLERHSLTPRATQLPGYTYAAFCLSDTYRSRVPLANSTPAFGRNVIAYISHIATK